MSLEICIQRACEEETPDDESLIRWATAALELTGEWELTIRLVDESESQTLNNEYRHKNKPTNVLSFPFENPPGLELPILGDLVICAAVVIREAAEQHKTTMSHWAHMVIHGVLHLQGYDHITDDEAEVMELRETALLTEMNYPPPYDP